MAEHFQLENDIRVSTLSRYPDVFIMEEQDNDEEELWALLEKTLRNACEAFVETREKAPKVVVKPVARPAATSAPAAPATPVVKPAAASTGKSGVKSPLPGVILDIKVNVGDTVKKGQVIIILEAMKMENNINADKDGKITAINVNKGDSVLEGTDLVIIE